MVKADAIRPDRSISLMSVVLQIGYRDVVRQLCETKLYCLRAAFGYFERLWLHWLHSCGGSARERLRRGLFHAECE